MPQLGAPDLVQSCAFAAHWTVWEEARGEKAAALSHALAPRSVGYTTQETQTRLTTIMCASQADRAGRQHLTINVTPAD